MVERGELGQEWRKGRQHSKMYYWASQSKHLLDRDLGSADSEAVLEEVICKLRSEMTK